ncbi:MAG TPA: CAP domain-containing protein [Actinomycetota bacterium]|nr:CAP domain-containing protein [Actinomycetota bacterium]
MTPAKLLASAALAAAALVAAPVSADPATVAATEQTLLAKSNGARADAGLTPLQWSSALADSARAHSEHMFESGGIVHSGDLMGIAMAAVPETRLAGENVGYSSVPSNLFDAFMASPKHQANILGDFNLAGNGIYEDSVGGYWVTVIFVKRSSADPVVAPPPAPVRSSRVASAATRSPREVAPKPMAAPPVPQPPVGTTVAPAGPEIAPSAEPLAVMAIANAPAGVRSSPPDKPAAPVTLPAGLVLLAAAGLTFISRDRLRGAA